MPMNFKITNSPFVNGYFVYSGGLEVVSINTTGWTPPPPPVWAIHILYVFALFLQLVRISLGSSRPTLHQRRYTLYVCTLCVAWFRTLVFVLLTAVYKNSEIYLITCTVYPRENKKIRSLGLLGDWAFNRERRVFIRIYAHPRPQIEIYTLLYANSLLLYCIFIYIVWTFYWQQQCYKLMHEYD